MLRCAAFSFDIYDLTPCSDKPVFMDLSRISKSEKKKEKKKDI